MLVALALAILPTTASAAEPANGTVSATNPKVTWSGTVQGGILFHNTFFYEPAGTLPCQAPGCDTFTLENADGTADLNLELASDQSPDISLRIKDPSGTWTYYNGWDDSSPATKVRLKKAPKGTYVINIVIRRLGSTQPTAVDDTSQYRGSASLAIVPSIAPPLTPGPVPAPAPPATPPAPAKPAPAKKPSAKAACQKKAKKIKNKRKRKAALKRCAKKR